MSSHNQPEPEQIDKELRVLELRRAGMTWYSIAMQTGYADHSGAYAAYKRAMKRTLQQPADEIREQEVDRIDRLTLALWPKAIQANEKAIMAVIKLMERRAKLLGLDAPTRIQQDVTVWEGGESIDRAVRDLAALLTQSHGDSTGESSMDESTGEIKSITAGDGLEELGHIIGSGLGQDSNGVGMDSLQSNPES